MPFQRPTLRQLQERFRQDIRTHTKGGNALLRPGVESVLAKVVPGLTHGLYGALAWIAEQIFPTTSDPAGVRGWAVLLGVTPRPAAFAIGEAQFATTGAPIPIGALARDPADGATYAVTSALVSSSVVIVELEAVEPGAAGNKGIGTPLVLVSPVAGVSSSGFVTDALGLHDGVDAENIEQLRTRVVKRIGNPPRGGAVGDYEGWALEEPGVTRVWVTPRVLGAGTVGVVIATDADPASPIPSPDKLAAVQARLEARAPVTIGVSKNSSHLAAGIAALPAGSEGLAGDWVGVVTSPPVALPLTIEIADLAIEDEADLAEVQDAIEAAVVAFLLAEAEPGVTIPLSRLDAAISSAAGETSHTLVQPSADIVPGPYELPVLSTITY